MGRTLPGAGRPDRRGGRRGTAPAGSAAATRFVAMPVDAQLSGPYVERSREDWAALAESAALALDADALDRVRGLGDPTSLADVREVYLPLSRLLTRYVLHTGELHRSSNEFLRLSVTRTPFVIGIA